MRKFITFFIVFTIQLAIIYGLYSMYVPGNSDNNNQSEKSETSREKAKGQNASSKNEKESSESIIKDLNKSVQKKSSEEEHSNNSNNSNKKIGQPFNYKHAVWGDISELSKSKFVDAGILVNLDTREVLWAKHSRKQVNVASMSKMMTALLAFEDINNKEDISMKTQIDVTKEAYRIGGCQVYLDPREKFTLKQLLKTVMIKSANDSAHLIAQYLGGGNVENFVSRMNKRAKELNMINPYFNNPSGLPEKHAYNDNKATPEGLVFLAERLLQYPTAVKWATTNLDYFREGSDKPMMLVNTNHLVRDDFKGITGLKTGYTDRSGFCITATCERNNTRLAAVITGVEKRRIRDNFAKNLLNWGYKRSNSLSKKDN